MCSVITCSTGAPTLETGTWIGTETQCAPFCTSRSSPPTCTRLTIAEGNSISSVPSIVGSSHVKGTQEAALSDCTVIGLEEISPGDSSPASCSTVDDTLSFTASSRCNSPQRLWASVTKPLRTSVWKRSIAIAKLALYVTRHRALGCELTVTLPLLRSRPYDITIQSPQDSDCGDPRCVGWLLWRSQHS